MVRTAGGRYCNVGLTPDDWDKTCGDMAENEEWDVEEVKKDRRVRSLAARNERVMEMHRRAAESTPGKLGEIIALHAPRLKKERLVTSPGRWWANTPECAGCAEDISGYEVEPPDWPCKTYKIATRRREGSPDDALSVLRDLVAQEDARPDGRFNPTIWRAAWARARALVAERPTDEEET